MQRIHDIYRPVEERTRDWREVERPLADGEIREQVARCMNCGQPFCHGAGCPLGNLVPDQNRAVAQGDWCRAYALLSANSDFPEFTSRVCPALCEASCVHGLDEEPVMVRQFEKRIIETAFAEGWVVPRPPERENGRSVAVVGGGPAGLSAAVTLRRRGFAVTVYERRAAIGGLLRYGIPCFKLDKGLIDRRRKVMEAEGIRFVTNCDVGRDVSAEWLARRNDAVVVAIGTPAARDLKIPGRELGGIHLALELLEGQNRHLTGEIAEAPVNARDRRVLVIGGGDTGSDCVGTAIRQGARSVAQIEIMPKPPEVRDASTPWPLWPYMLRTSSSHKEGCERRWNLNSLRFVGEGGAVAGVEVETVEWEFSPDGRPLKFHAVPDGDWLILRIGAICNGKCNHPASKHGQGLEVDKLSASAVDFHFDQYVARLCRTLGPLAGNVESGLNNILVDSYEVGCQNWTQGLDAIFGQRTGYSIKPWLPVFAGRVVGSVEESERFLEDFRRVVADLFAENYAGRLAWNCHRLGLQFSLEPYGNCPSDHLQYGRSADIPMGECWSRAAGGDHVITPGAGKFAASVAHVWGRRYVGMESFTATPSTGGRWLTTPFAIKAQCDRIYTEGINRVIYHRFVHQPWPGGKYLPGMTMGRWGMHLDRTQTWWRHAGAWFRYQARCQWMLQEGRPVADVLFYAGGHVPNQGRQTDGVANPDDMKIPYGYDWDICATEALEALKVVDGKVIAPGGVAYSLLVLPPHDTMAGSVLAAVGRLVESGAKICGMAKPIRSPGLAGWPDADARVREMADRIWAKGVMQCTPAEALERLALPPDFGSDARDLWSGAAYIHRRDAEADWYFVACNNSTDRIVEASFRQTGRVPEIWDAETGSIAEARSWRMENGRTAVELRFPPSGSAFVVFRRETKETQSPPFAETPESVAGAELTAPLHVSFPVGWYSGGKEVKTIECNSLQDWAASDDPDIRYFSGTATYSTRIMLPSQRSERVVLDLGEVRNFAVVTVNGTPFPVLWRPPFRVDITDALEPGDTSFALEIEVTNLWPNRLIGDDCLPEDCEWEGTVKNGVKEIGIKELPDWVKRGERSPTGRHTFTTWKHWDRDDALLPSGLLGPITLRTSGK